MHLSLQNCNIFVGNVETPPFCSLSKLRCQKVQHNVTHAMVLILIMYLVVQREAPLVTSVSYRCMFYGGILRHLMKHEHLLKAFLRDEEFTVLFSYGNWIPQHKH